MLSELRETPAVVQTAAGDGAHLVVQLGPARAPAAMTEPDEIEGGVGGAGIWFLACANPSMHSLLYRDMESQPWLTDRRLGPGWDPVPPRLSPPRQAGCMLGGCRGRRIGVSPPRIPPSFPQNGRSKTVCSTGSIRRPGKAPNQLGATRQPGLLRPARRPVGPEHATPEPCGPKERRRLDASAFVRVAVS